jgi:hypothetical protein
MLASGRRKRSERAVERFSRVERDWLLLLKRVAAKNACLVVVENAHWWDLQSAQLIAAAANEELREQLAGLRRLHVLVVDTDTESQTTGDEVARDLLVGLATADERIELCDVDTFALVLRALGVAEELPSDLITMLHTATGGHLSLAAAISAAVSDGESLLDEGGAVRRLLSDKLMRLAVSDPELSEIVARAAVLGSQFQERELLCITERNRPAELREAVGRAVQTGLFGRGQPALGFAHESIWQAVREYSAGSDAALFAKLADCLAILRPGDYASRAAAYEAASEHERAGEYYVLAAVAQIRQGSGLVLALSVLPDRVAGDGVTVDALGTLADAYGAISRGDFVAGRKALHAQLPTVLLSAERAYAQAICAMESQTEEGVIEASGILQEWLEAVQGEPELYSRFLVLRVQVEVLGERFDEARRTEQAVERLLAQRAAYDPSAARTLQIQNRRAASTRAPEIARLSIADAVRHFRRATASGSPESIELYRSLTNLVAVEVRLGRDADAHAHAEEAAAIAFDLGGAVPRMDVLGNNAAIAGLRAAAFDAVAAVERQLAVVDAAQEAGDGFIQRCNLVAFRLLASHDVEAQALLYELRAEFVAHGYTETYLRYYLGVLEVACLYLTGETHAALDSHRALDPFIASLRWPSAAYVRRRHKLLEPRLEQPLNGDRLEADRTLLATNSYEIGEAWSYYARFIPLCELSYWSDS